MKNKQNNITKTHLRINLNLLLYVQSQQIITQSPKNIKTTLQKTYNKFKDGVQKRTIRELKAD